MMREAALLVLMFCTVGPAWADPVPTPASAASEAPASTAAEKPATVAVPVEADWQARALAWFKDADTEKARKAAMREAGRAIKQPCRYCHTPDWQGYTDVQPVARQMMALSVENGVACSDCHAGKAELTPLGEQARPMWALAHERKQFCDACHVPATRFKQLTEAGRIFDAEEKARTKP